jgi:hypothetical protein
VSTDPGCEKTRPSNEEVGRCRAGIKSPVDRAFLCSEVARPCANSQLCLTLAKGEQCHSANLNRLASAIPASSDETSAKPRRTKGSKLDADEGSNLQAD